MRDFKPATLLVLCALALLATTACRPGPDDEVEYLQREDSVIIQMLTVQAGASESARRLAVPELTLYGDGTLIYKQSATDGTRLLQTTLPDAAVLDLLTSAVDEGFLGYFYDQSSRNSTGPTTFLYAHTLDRANAVAIRPEGRPQEGLEEQSASTLAIIEDLRALDLAALGAGEPAEFVPEALLLLIEPVDQPDAAGAPPYLPGLDLNFAAIAPPGGGPVEHQVDGEAAAKLWSAVSGGSAQGSHLTIGPVVQGESAYMISFAPVLPFSENFPLFD